MTEPNEGNMSPTLTILLSPSLTPHAQQSKLLRVLAVHRAQARQQRLLGPLVRAMQGLGGLGTISSHLQEGRGGAVGSHLQEGTGSSRQYSDDGVQTKLLVQGSAGRPTSRSNQTPPGRLVRGTTANAPLSQSRNPPWCRPPSGWLGQASPPAT